MINYSDEYVKSIEDALNEEAFAEKVRGAQSKEELTSLFAEKGIETEEEMVDAMFTKMNSISNGEELSEEEMELVAGGKSRFSLRRVVYSLAAGAMVVGAISTGNPAVIALGVGAALQLTYYGAKKDLGR